LTVCTAAVGLGLGGWLVTTQVSSVLAELPEHTQNVRTKVRSLKRVVERSSRLARMLVDVNEELGGPVARPRFESNRAAGDGPPQRPPATPAAEPELSVWLARITLFLSPLLGLLSELALAIILVVFMLQKREELRNRLIRLAGHGRIAATTKFVDEAGQRVSRFLLMQAIVNGSFGLVLGLGLFFIGVKYWLLWGFLGAMLRYLPYVGPLIAAFFPISFSVALNDGWGSTLLVIALFLILEILIAHFVEPWLYAQTMSVSALALLVSAAFCAFLWGPIGLVLSSPFTVCLVMLGRYVPRLEFLAVLLGDEPALAPSVSFYQRLLAHDQHEAEELLIDRLKSESLGQVCDEMLVPALGAIKLSRLRGEIDHADQQSALQAIREIVDDIAERHVGSGAPGDERSGSNSSSQPATRPPLSLFGCPARDETDRAALEILASLVDPKLWKIELIAPATLTAELLEMIAAKKPALVCIASVPPGGHAHTRYLCKRLRARFPDLQIIVGRWGSEARGVGDQAPRAASALPIATTLLETCRQLHSLRPVLEERTRHPAAVDPASGGERIGASPAAATSDYPPARDEIAFRPASAHDHRGRAAVTRPGKRS
jgi:predicted PurR-regulated permease PerM